MKKKQSKKSKKKWYDPYLLAKSQAVRIKFAEHNILWFALFYLHKHFNFKTPQFHKDWIEMFKTSERCIIACPRGHAKSSWWSFVFVLWCILYKKKKFIILFSDTQTQANQFLGQIVEELETNEAIIRDFGKIAGYVPSTAEDKKKWTTADIVTTTNIRVSSFGFGAKVRGIKHSGGRPDLIILDDVENDQSVNTKTQRDKYKNIFRKSVLNLGDEKTQIIVVGTVLHFDSLLNSIIEKPPKGYDVRIYKAIENGEPLWKERWTLEDLENKKAEIGSVAFEQEYMNNPLDEGSQIIKPQAFFIQRDIQDVKLDYYAYLDLAISEKETADYTALVTIGKDKKTGNIYVVDADRIRGDVYKQLDFVYNKYSRFKHTRIGIESVAYQKAFFQMAKHESNKRGIHLPVIEIKVDKDKVRRAMEILVYIENGTVKFRNDYDDFLTEIRQFPKGEHDDFCDSLVGGIRMTIKNNISFSSNY